MIYSSFWDELLRDNANQQARYCFCHRYVQDFWGRMGFIEFFHRIVNQ